MIQADGTVTFRVRPLHQVAIYEPGTRPEDIDVNQTEPIPGFAFPLVRIIDDNGLVERGPAQNFAPETTWTSAPFTEPGRYLVICTTFAHFAFANMYAWVTVK